VTPDELEAIRARDAGCKSPFHVACHDRRALLAEVDRLSAQTRPCTEGKDGGTCDGTDHVRHLVWSCFTATELGVMRDEAEPMPYPEDDIKDERNRILAELEEDWLETGPWANSIACETVGDPYRRVVAVVRGKK
jgi:hypothetical protein